MIIISPITQKATEKELDNSYAFGIAVFLFVVVWGIAYYFYKIIRFHEKIFRKIKIIFPQKFWRI